MSERKGAILTRDLAFAANALNSGYNVATAFEPNGHFHGNSTIYGFFNNGQDIGSLAELKHRGVDEKTGSTKPFVVTLNPNSIADVEQLRALAQINDSVPRDVIANVTRFLRAGFQQHTKPMGIIIPAAPGVEDSRRGIMQIPGTSNQVETVAFMLPGGGLNNNFSQLMQEAGRDSIQGTSANDSRDKKRTNGSSHSHLAGLVAQYADKGDVCVFMPGAMCDHGNSSSTTQVLITPEGGAFINRLGSLSEKATAKLLLDSGIEYQGRTESGKAIGHYDYTGYRLLDETLADLQQLCEDNEHVELDSDVACKLQDQVLPDDVRALVRSAE